MYKTARSSNDLTQMVYVALRKKRANETTKENFECYNFKGLSQKGTVRLSSHLWFRKNEYTYVNARRMSAYFFITFIRIKVSETCTKWNACHYFFLKKLNIVIVSVVSTSEQCKSGFVSLNSKVLVVCWFFISDSKYLQWLVQPEDSLNMAAHAFRWGFILHYFICR